MSKNNVTLQDQIENSFLFGGSAAYLEEQYELYLQNPDLVSPEWRKHFDSLPKVNGNIAGDVSHAAIRDYFANLAYQPIAYSAESGTSEHVRKQGHVLQLINAYRSHGHRLAQLDPLGLRKFPTIPALQLSTYELSTADLTTEFETNSFATIGKKRASLATIVDDLKKIYCGSIGIEYMYINDSTQIDWIQRYLEPTCGNFQLKADEQRQVLQKLTATEGLERYLATRYVGQKRFSLEGGDSFIPMMNELIENSAKHGMQEVVIGMAHRGRLNVLINILGKAPAKLFEEFEGKYNNSELSGDVKYHKGYSSDVKTANGIVHLVLGFNPSHLEIIAPVAEGSVKARQVRRHDNAGKQVLPIIIHGDAAFAGQGVVMETFALSKANGYETGGSVHIVINNQIGFTTNNPLDTRGYGYSTDVAKMVDAPIIHVNGDDPDAVIFATRMAHEFRMQFHKDVVIDLVCYRRLGHNEADEPAMTQPVIYQKVKAQPTTLTLYTSKLIAAGVVSADDAKALVDAYRNALDKGEPVVNLVTPKASQYIVDWKPYWGTHWDVAAKTAVPKDTLIALGKKVTTIPTDFHLQPQVAKEYEARRAMIAGQQPLHWGMAETLAYASLLEDGFAVRLAGQDAGRGTFSHRHSVLHDINTDNCYVPLAHIAKEQPEFTVLDTILSEEAVMAFEYGYASADPRTLVIWEAQFGDFYNGAQVVVDQFLSSSEQKWGRLCGLTLLLPHGLEGMGPEHSSARLERFLQLCAQENMQVAVPTTPAQCFHLLRRQMLRNYRKPLIVLTPKSLLRHKLAVSSIEDLTQGQFMPVISDDIANTKGINRVVFCSGRVYYELIQQRDKLKRTDTAIIRIEQLYPLPTALIQAELNKYNHVNNIIWCQDEAENQGAWLFVKEYLSPLLGKTQKIHYAGRPAAAAPAVGSVHTHAEQQQALLDNAFA
jgi:2-oxoglutarate dehydrogenase E1 component